MNRFLIVILICARILAAEGPYYQNRLLFCIQDDVDHLKTTFLGKKPATGLPAIDRLLSMHNAVRMEKWLTSADDSDVIDGVNLSKIYRVVFAENKSTEDIRAIRDAFKAIGDVHSAGKEPRLTLHQSLSPYVPSDSYFAQQWYLKKIMADYAWALWKGAVPGDSTVIVGVVDSGIDYLHPDLAGAMYLNPGEDVDGDGLLTAADSNNIDDDGNGYKDDFYGWDFVGGYQNGGKFPDNDIRPPNAGPDKELSHGTHVAGVMAAVSDNALGMSSIGFTCKLIGTKHSYDDELSEVNIDDGYDGILYLAKRGADIINCSWGGEGYSAYANYVMNQVKNYDAIVVCAAGNDSRNSDNTPHYPSDFESTISVAALGSNDVKAGFSNYGSSIDISAPGVSIFSTIHWGQGDYASWPGTSMASPIVGGSLALLKAFFPDSSRDWLIETLLDMADPIDDKNPSYAGRLGSGRVNIFNAIGSSLYPLITMTSYTVYTIQTTLAGQSERIRPGEEAALTISLSNDEKWTPAHDLQIKLRSPDASVVVLDSIALYSSISPGDTVTNFSDLLEIRLADSARIQPYDLDVVITANDTSAFPYSDVLTLTVEPSMDMPGFPRTGVPVTAPLGVADIAGDSLKEIIMVGGNDSLYVFEASGKILHGFPVSLESYTTMAPVIADMDADGKREIVVINRSGLIRMFKPDGTIRFELDMDETFRGDAAVGNVDSDPDLELVFGTYENMLHAVNLDSSEVSGFPVTFNERIGTGAALADFNSDGRADIVVGNENDELHVITATGDSLDGFPVTLSDALNAPPLVMNSDEDLLIIFPQKDQKLIIMNAQGAILSAYDAGANVEQPAALADFNDDQIPEIIFFSDDGNIHVIDVDGNIIDNFSATTDGMPKTAPVIANQDDDPLPEIIAGTETGNLEVIRIDGTSIKNFPASFSGSLNATPVVADLDRDGDAELIIGGNDGLRVLDMPSAYHKNYRYWPTYLGNNRRTGYYADALTGLAEIKRHDIPEKLRLMQNYPNPFNPVTTIPVSVPSGNAGNEVSLIIYNILGQRVNTLFRGRLPGGYHEFQWTGRNGSGRLMGSGFYFIRLESETSSLTRRILLLK